MKRMFKGKKRSIVRFCIFNFVFYSVIVLLLFLVLNSLVIKKLNRTFPSINNILEYRAELENDDFSSIPKNEYENCGFLVFDIEEICFLPPMKTFQKVLQAMISGLSTVMIQEHIIRFLRWSWMMEVWVIL